MSEHETGRRRIAGALVSSDGSDEQEASETAADQLRSKRVSGRPRRGRPTPEAAADLTDLIVAVARDEFMKRGYAGCSIERIAKTCGINKHTFYRRFASKGDLFLFLLRQSTDRVLASIDAVNEDPADALLHLKMFMRSILEAYCEPEYLGLSRIVLSESLVPAAVKAELSSPRPHGLLDRIDRFLVVAQTCGQIVDGSVPTMRDLLAHSILGTVLYGRMVWDEHFRTRGERDAMFDYLWTAFVHRFGRAPETPSPA